MTGSIYDWSLTAASNSAADDDINWAEGQDPDTVNNSSRQMMARLAEFLKDSAAIRVSSGAANTYTVTANSAPAALRDGYTIVFRSHQANTTTATLSVNSYGAKPIRSRSGTALLANEILSGVVVVAQYNLATDEFILQSSPNLWLQTLGPALLQSQTFGLRAGDVKMSFANTPDAGFIRLTETAQVFTRTDYPDLYPAMIAATGYPWGATVSGTTFAVPPAGGYIPRFGATGTTVNPDGVQAAGTVNTDRIKAHNHTASASTSISHNANTNNPQSTIAGSGVPVSGIVYTSGASISASTSVTIANNGAETETAPKTVIFWADMLAVPALVAASLTGVAGHYFRFNSAISAADPGTGYFSLNNATVGSATALYISETDANSVSLATRLAAYASGSSVLITKVGSPQNAIMFTLASTATDNGAWDTFTISSASISGTISNGDACTVVVMPAGATGPAGSTGTAGASGPNVGLDYAWSTSTGTPSSGQILVDNATLASATTLKVSETNRVGASQATTLTTWDDSTSSVKGMVRIIDVANAGTNWIEYNITGAITDAGAYDTFPITYVNSAGTIANATVVSVAFFPKGDKGTDGSGSGSVTSVSPGAGVTSDTTANAPGSAVTVSGTFSAAQLVNAQTGTTYTVADGDRAKLVTLSNASAIAVTLPQAGQTTTFKTGWFVDVVNIGAGTVTITPTTSTINGAASIALLTGRGCRIVSDGTNYQISMVPLSIVLASGKTLTVSNSLTLAGTDATTMTFPGTSSTVLTTGNSATISKGFSVNPNNIGTVSSGTTTPDPANGNYQYMTNNGAFTLAVPSSDCAIDILVTNGASAGAITFSGFTVGSVTGSALTTTNTNKFVISIRRINSVSTYSIYALQ